MIWPRVSETEKDQHGKSLESTGEHHRRLNLKRKKKQIQYCLKYLNLSPKKKLSTMRISERKLSKMSFDT